MNYNIKNGLPSNNVYAIKQDKRGFIWATTDKGVVRFDGKNFKLYTVDRGLASNDNFAMLIDSKDNVWLYSFKAISRIGRDGSIGYFGETNSYYSHFIVTENDDIYYSTVFNSKNTLSHSMIRNSTFFNLKLPHDKYQGFSSLGFDFNGKYTVLGGSKWNLDSLYFLSYNGKEFIENKELKNFTILPEIFSDNRTTLDIIKVNNHYLIFSSNFYSKFDSKVNSKVLKYPLYLNKVGSGNILNFEEKLFLVFNKGVYVYDIKTEIWSQLLSTSKASSLLIDYEKSIWVATMGNGLMKYSTLNPKSGKENIKKLSTESTKKVNGYKNETLWIANSRNEVIELKKGKKKFAPDLIDLRFLETDTKNDIYYGGSNAVYKNGKVFSNFGFKAMDINNDSLAFTTTFGVNFLEKKDLKSFRGYDNRQLTDVTGRMYAIKMLRGKFYSGNQQGLYRGTPYEDKLHPICLDDRQESVSVNAIEQTQDGLLWVATEGNGIYALKDDVVVRHFDKELLDANIHALKVDEKDRVWLATRKGVNSLQKAGDDFNVSAYTSFHGLPSDFVNDVYCYDDQLYVATDDGLVQVDLNKVKPSDFKFKPPVFINTIKVFGTSWVTISSDTFSVLNHDQNTVSFEYSGISYRSNGNIRFEYRLLPIVPDWVQTTNDNITFNQLKPGKYTFEVRAIDALGNVSDKAAISKFEIQKHFTEELWFKILLLFAVLLLFLLLVTKYFQYKKSKTEEMNRVENLISELRLKSLQSQLNPHFIFNSLNAIQQFINTENKKSANDYLSKFARLMRLYLNGSDTMFITLEQELEVLKLYCNLEHLRFADKFQYSIHIEDGLSLSQYKVPAMLLQPYVENAIRHGLIPSDKDTKLLKINVKSMEGGIVCVIEDTGIGRSKSMELKKERSSDHRSMGNKISKERLEMIRSLKLGNISEKITDIVDDHGQICGTSVQIMIKTITDK